MIFGRLANADDVPPDTVERMAAAATHQPPDRKH
jgi:hypothetical protein